MTKQKATYLWGLLFLFLLISHSCRNDVLLENQIPEKKQISGMTHKIFSFNEIKHNDRLISQLKTLKNKFNKLNKKSNRTKSVNYGDSITINTDKVIYIENENYHTYTFNIQRSQPSPNDPVENLLLAPLPDGSYKEFLVTYDLTQQEKGDIRNELYFY